MSRRSKGGPWAKAYVRQQSPGRGGRDPFPADIAQPARRPPGQPLLPGALPTAGGDSRLSGSAVSSLPQPGPEIPVRVHGPGGEAAVGEPKGEGLHIPPSAEYVFEGVPGAERENREGLNAVKKPGGLQKLPLTPVSGVKRETWAGT